jgi:hypothetical protein
MQIGFIDSRLSNVPTNQVGQTFVHCPKTNNWVNHQMLSVKPSKNTKHADCSLYTFYYSFSRINTNNDAGLKVYSVALKEYSISLLALVEQLNRLIAVSPKVICMPIGISKHLPLLHSLVRTLHQKNILLVTPSGNKGAGKVLYPGLYVETLCVGAANQYSTIAHFSGNQYNESGVCKKPDVLAFGVDIEIPDVNGNIHRTSGTSLACASVAGLAAALFHANPEATPFEVKQAIYNSCTPTSGSRYGIINTEKALRNILTSSAQFKIDEIDVYEYGYVNPSPYISSSVKRQCIHAVKLNRKVQSLVLAKDTLALMQRLAQYYSKDEFTFEFFDGLNIAHVKATTLIYEKLFNLPELQICSEIDINYFDI